MDTNDLLNDILYWMDYSGDEEDLLFELKDSDPDVWADYTSFSEMFSRCVNKLEARDEPQYELPAL
jgi:hypothetical protein